MKKFECNYCHEKFSRFSIYDCPNCGSGDVCQIMDDKLCGWQPTGRSEDVPKPPKYNLNAEFWRTQWSEASGAHLMEYLRAEKLKEQIDTVKKALTEIAEIIDDNIHECNYGCDNFCEFWGSLNRYAVENLQSVTDSALAEIGGDDE